MFHSALNILREVSNGFIAKESISPSLLVRGNFGNEQDEGFSKLNNKLIMMAYIIIPMKIGQSQNQGWQNNAT